MKLLNQRFFFLVDHHMIAQSALHPPTSDSGLIVPCGIIYPSLSFKKLVDGPISSIYQQLNDDNNNSVVVCSHIF